MADPLLLPLSGNMLGVSFPLVAITIAAFHYGEHNPAPVLGIIAGLLLLLSSVVITFLLGQTIYRIATGTFVLAPPPPPVPTTLPTPVPEAQ